VIRAIEQIARELEANLNARIADPLPWKIERGLSHADALLGQFELICCDCISVFISDKVLSRASPEYLAQLYNQLRASSEFERVTASLESLPAGPGATEFRNRFDLPMPVDLPQEVVVMRKKARSMKQAAERLGARLLIKNLE
jgi:hypothetical protein